MSDFSLDIDTSALVQALRSLDNLGDGWAKMVNTVVRENKRMEAATGQSIKAQLEAKRRLDEANAKTSNDKWFADQRRKIAMMEQSARMEQKTANEAAKASDMVVRAKEAEAREVERLKVKYKDGYAAAALYRKMQDEITKAHKLGAISTNQYEAQLESLSAEFTQFANGGAAAGNRFAGATVGATRQMSSMGVVTQQVGYQVGDFAVQVQSGQSALVAFSQQATQLVGVLPLMSDQLGISSGKLIALSAGLGIAIPVVTALAGILWTVSQSAKDAEEKTTRFEDALKAARSTVQGMEDDLRLLESGFKNTFELALSDNVDVAKDKLKEAEEALASMGEAEVSLFGLNFLVGTDKLLDASRERIALAEEAVYLAQIELAGAQELARQVENRKRDESVVNQLHEVRQARIQTAFELEADQDALRKESLNDLAKILALKDVEKRFGEDSLEYFRQEQEFRKAIYAQEVMQLDIAQDKKIALIESNNEILDMQTQVRILAGDFNTAAAAAWGIYEGLSATVGARAVQSGVASGAIPPQALADLPLSAADEFRASRRDDAIDEARKAREKASRPGRSGGRKSGGSKSAKVEQDDFIEKMKEEMELRKDLLKLFGDERDLQEEINRIVKGLGKDKKKYSDQAIEGIAQQNLLLQEQEELYDKSVEQMQSISDNLETSMGQAFTSMIDGTASVEDAFKNMAKSIIDQLIQIFIVEQMVGSIMGSLGGAFGGGGLSSLKPPKLFADGGVVNRATNFAMTDGGMGTMGEAGPEAIMPLKRGANGKLGVQMEGGSSQSVVVHQNFNFTANGDETVKKLISQAAPQIAQLTKNSLLNDRRRGGQTKSVFG